MDKLILITNIQHFSLHDGPGIRTTVFLKGCSVRCPWCSNPENLSANIQHYVKAGKEGIYGKYYTQNELYAEILKDRAFYGEYTNDYNIKKPSEIDLLPGGVTFSGGECLLQADALLPLLEILNREKIHITVETSLFAPEDNICKIMQYINFYYIDLKIINKNRCRSVLLGDSELFIKNLDTLMYSGKPIVIRIPVIGKITDCDENRKDIINLLNKYLQSSQVNLLKIELIKEHNLGIEKYKSLSICNEGYKEPVYHGVTSASMEQYKKELKHYIKKEIPVEICSIG